MLLIYQFNCVSPKIIKCLPFLSDYFLRWYDFSIIFFSAMFIRAICELLKYSLCNFLNPNISFWLEFQIILSFIHLNRYVWVNITYIYIVYIQGYWGLQEIKTMFKKSLKSPKRFRCIYQAKVKLWKYQPLNYSPLSHPALLLKENLTRENLVSFP